MVIKAVVFDIGGVLLEDPKTDDFWRAKKKETKKLRGEFGSGFISKDEFVERGSKLLKISKNKFLEDYKKYYLFVKKIEPSFEIYKNLKTKKALFTNTNPIHLEYIKRTYLDLFQLADVVVASSEAHCRKSQDEFYKKMIEMVGFAPEEILFVDNKERNLNMAKELGIQTILYKSPAQLSKELDKFGVK